MAQNSRIRGYEILRKLTRVDVPPHFQLDKKHRGSYGFLIPSQIDPLELGLIQNPGHFELLPIQTDGKPLWDEVTDLIVTEDQAAQQIDIASRFARALFDLLPSDAADLDDILNGASPPGRLSLLSLLGQAAVDTWTELRRGSAPLDEPERLRLQSAVAERVAAYLRDLPPRCRLDKQGIHLVAALPYRRLWARIDTAIVQGDYEDASLRALSRLALTPPLLLPVENVLRLLPGVPRLDLFFLFVRCSTGDILHHLIDWLLYGTIDSNPLIAEYAVRALFAVIHFGESFSFAQPIIQFSLPRLRCEPATIGARRIKLWMEALCGDEHAVHSLQADKALSEEVDQVLETWQLALEMKLADVFATLPERA